MPLPRTSVRSMRGRDCHRQACPDRSLKRPALFRDACPAWAGQDVPTNEPPRRGDGLSQLVGLLSESRPGGRRFGTCGPDARSGPHEPAWSWQWVWTWSRWPCAAPVWAGRLQATCPALPGSSEPIANRRVRADANPAGGWSRAKRTRRRPQRQSVRRPRCQVQRAPFPGHGWTCPNPVICRSRPIHGTRTGQDRTVWSSQDQATTGPGQRPWPGRRCRPIPGHGAPTESRGDHRSMAFLAAAAARATWAGARGHRPDLACLAWSPHDRREPREPPSRPMHRLEHHGLRASRQHPRCNRPTSGSPTRRVGAVGIRSRHAMFALSRP
jgi:hypothetical protein